MQNAYPASKKAIRVLMLEHSEHDAALILNELSLSGVPTISSRVDSEAEFQSALVDFGPDVVLCDHSLGEFDALSALAILRELRPTTPLILVTGSVTAETAVACVRGGAEDLILKEDLSRLAAAMTEAIDLRRPLRKLTARQREVLRMVAEGRRTRDIATELKLSVKTVESHRTEMMRRLDIHDIAGLVRYAILVRVVPLTT